MSDLQQANIASSHIPGSYAKTQTNGITRYSSEALDKIRDILQSRMIGSHLTGELWISPQEIDRIGAVFNNGLELYKNFLDLLKISELFVVIWDGNGKLVSASQSYLKAIGYTRDEINQFPRGGIPFKEVAYHQDVVPEEYKRVTGAVIEAEQGAGYQFKEFEMVTAWHDQDQPEELIKLKALWTTFAGTNGGTIRIGIPDYMIPGRNPCPPFERAVEANKLTKFENSIAWELLDGAPIYPNLSKKMQDLQAKVRTSVQGALLKDVVLKDFGDMLEGVLAYQSVIANLEALDNQMAFGIARYNIDGKPTFWSKAMEHHLGYTLAHLQYYLDDWKGFFFGPVGSMTRFEAEKVIASRGQLDMFDEPMIPTVYGWGITLEEYDVHEKAAKEGKADLMNLFYAYTEEELASVQWFVTKLMSRGNANRDVNDRGYSEVLFNPRGASGFPVSSMWTSIGLKDGNIRVMRPCIARDEEERGFDRVLTEEDTMM